MKQETEKETNLLLEAFENPDSIAEVKSAQMEDPKENLGKVMLDFFNDRLDQIKQSTDFKNEVREELRKKIKAGEIKGDNLAKLLISLEEQDSIKDASVFALLRPNNGSNNPLLSSFTRKTESLVDAKLNDGPTQRSADQLSRLMQKLESMAEAENKIN